MTGRFILFTLSLILIPFVTKGQTSLEEYTYLTKGYKVQIESGLDMKKGYELSDSKIYTSGPRSLSLSKLLNTNSGSKKQVAYLLIYQHEKAKKEFICIPHPKSNKEVLDLYWEQLQKDPSIVDDNSTRKLLIAYFLSQNLNWD